MTQQKVDIVGAIRHLGTCLRYGKETWMGVPAENVCVVAADEIERLRAKIKAMDDAITAFSVAMAVSGGPALAVQRHDASWEAWKALCETCRD